MSINLLIKLVLTGSNLIYYYICENLMKIGTKCNDLLNCYISYHRVCKSENKVPFSG